MLGLHSLLDPVKKGTRLPLREGGREKGGREKQQISPAVDFPQVPLVIISKVAHSGSLRELRTLLNYEN